MHQSRRLSQDVNVKREATNRPFARIGVFIIEHRCSTR